MELTIPANALEFDRVYGSEESCRAAVIQARWPDGFACPRCEDRRHWVHHNRPVIECPQGHQTSFFGGTIFHSTKLALRTLFKLIYLFVATKSGTNMSELSRQTGVSYPTAMLWARKIRRIIATRENTRLEGTVEVDETQLGGPAENCPGRALGENQAMIVVLVEDLGGMKCGRARLEVIPSASGEDLSRVVNDKVEPGSTIRTDGWKGYDALDEETYSRIVKNIKQSNKSASAELPLVHRVASLLKRFIIGVLQGSWTFRWLPDLLEEFTFRFNRRKSNARPKLFHRILEDGVNRRPPTRHAFQLYSRTLREIHTATT